MGRILTLMFAGFMVFTGPAMASDEHDHHHASTGDKAQKLLKPEKKYETDAALRSNMGAIRAALQKKMPDVHGRKLKAEEYSTLSTEINKSVQTIFKECKLKADADAALHLILADVMAGSKAMKSGPNADDRAKGFLKIAKGLETYGQIFNDPSWKPLTH